MLATVRSRIREIGIRKALGATSREIKMQFLEERLSLSGGIIGTILVLLLPLAVRFSLPTLFPSPVVYCHRAGYLGGGGGYLRYTAGERAAELDRSSRSSTVGAC